MTAIQLEIAKKIRVSSFSVLVSFNNACNDIPQIDKNSLEIWGGGFFIINPHVAF